MSAGLTSVVRNLEAWAERKKAGALALGNVWAGRLEGQAKANRPWKDRTSHAKQGLFGRAIQDKGDVVIALAHTVQYGVWLELARDGRYAIVKPTMDRAIPEIRKSYEQLWRER